MVFILMEKRSEKVSKRIDVFESMKKIRVLNLYAGIGGNRAMWPDDKINVTAVEINPRIARVYGELFPDDKVVVGDAHEYLLKHFKRFDFIWSSPPCPTHSKMKMARVNIGQEKPFYSDMRLYQEILFLKTFCQTKWVVENVESFYEPLIKPVQIKRHYFWANFPLVQIYIIGDDRIEKASREYLEKRYGIDTKKYKRLINRRQCLRNCVNPVIGKHIFDLAFRNVQTRLRP